jgi:mono/diheme cytochrome c family protein
LAMRSSETGKIRPGPALFTILLVISGCEGGVPTAPADSLRSREVQQAGAAIFAANCAICHGARADGRGQRTEGMSPPPANLRLPPWSDTAAAGKTFLVIRNGVPGTAMPSWPALTDQQIWQVVAYITSLSRAERRETAR